MQETLYIIPMKALIFRELPLLQDWWNCHAVIQIPQSISSGAITFLVPPLELEHSEC